MLVRCFYSGLVGGLPFVARVALLDCIGGLAFVVCAFGSFLLWFLIAYACPATASLCNFLSTLLLLLVASKPPFNSNTIGASFHAFLLCYNRKAEVEQEPRRQNLLGLGTG